MLDPIVPNANPGLLSYPNSLNTALVREIILTYTDPGHMVTDLFVGSGTTPLVCAFTDRNFIGGDINEHAMRFTMGRFLSIYDQQADRLDLQLEADGVGMPSFAHARGPSLSLL